jgi:hypothetical protein
LRAVAELRAFLYHGVRYPDESDVLPLELVRLAPTVAGIGAGHIVTGGSPVHRSVLGCCLWMGSDCDRGLGGSLVCFALVWVVEHKTMDTERG